MPEWVLPFTRLSLLLILSKVLVPELGSQMAYPYETSSRKSRIQIWVHLT